MLSSSVGRKGEEVVMMTEQITQKMKLNQHHIKDGDKQAEKDNKQLEADHSPSTNELIVKRFGSFWLFATFS